MVEFLFFNRCLLEISVVNRPVTLTVSCLATLKFGSSPPWVPTLTPPLSTLLPLFFWFFVSSFFRTEICFACLLIVLCFLGGFLHCGLGFTVSSTWFWRWLEGCDFVTNNVSLLLSLDNCSVDCLFKDKFLCWIWPMADFRVFLLLSVCSLCNLTDDLLDKSLIMGALGTTTLGSWNL